MWTLFEPILEHLRVLARGVEVFGIEETRAIDQIADQLQRFSIGGDDLRTWLSNEIELEANADRLHLLLRHNYRGSRRELVETIGELLIVVRIVRAQIVAERFPELPESLIEGPASVLHNLLVLQDPDSRPLNVVVE